MQELHVLGVHVRNIVKNVKGNAMVVFSVHVHAENDVSASEMPKFPTSHKQTIWPISLASKPKITL